MKRLLLVVLSIFCSISVWCADGDTFTAKTVEGVDMTFTIISEEQKTCKVGYTYEKKKGVRIAIDKLTSGAITIPAIANGYNVKAIADDAFYSCSQITSIVVPDGVTYIGKSAFQSCAKVETISIPNSVTGDSFGDRTFAGCKSLNAINIPEGVNSIGPLAFSSCESLTSVTIPTTVNAIYEQAFSGCTSLSSITLPDNLKYIGSSALSGTCITSLTLPKSFTTSHGVDYLSYSGTQIGTINTLKTVYISRGVSSLYEVFKYCTHIEKIICYNEKPVNAADCWKSGITPILYVPEGSKELYKADNNWKNLMIDEMKNVSFADANVKNICINKWDLDGDGEINQLELSEITDIEQTFRNHADITNFTELKYFANLTTIGDNAFSDCTNLISVTIPANVKSIGTGSFYGCNKLTSVYAESPEPCMLSFNSFPNRRNAILYVPAGSKSAYSSASFWQDFKSIEEIDISSINIAFADSDVKAICVANANWDTNGDGELSMAEAAAITDLGTVFYYKSIKKFNELQYFTGLSALAYSAFNGCTYLESIVLPQTITSIGRYAFSNCCALKSITIPDKVESIEERAFSFCSGLNSIILGNGVNNIGEYAFLCNSSLTDFYCYANEVPTTHNTAFVNSNISSATLYVPNGSIDAYKSNSPWSDFMTINSVPTEVKIAINETNFPDVNFRTYLQAQSYGSDGVLTDTEIASISSMDVSNRSISNLKGIEYFTALTSLSCYSNQIKGDAMDILIGNLPSVENGSLNIIWNENESNIMTTTQVVAAKAKGWIPMCYDGSNWGQYVSVVYINEINFPDEKFRNYLKAQSYGEDGVITDTEICSITNINVSRQRMITSLKGIEYFIALEVLKCSYNRLTTLDLSNNTILKSLECLSNQLTSLDVSKNTALTSLVCFNNKLTTLDVSKNTALKYLHCENNKLTALDVSKNTELTTLTCSDNQLTTLNFSKNTALTKLECYNNQLTALDVSNNTALVSLNCSKNLLTSLVSNNTALTGLNCSSNQLTALDVSNNIELTTLTCSSNQLTALDVSKNTALTKLNCSDNKLTSLDVSNNTALVTLNCSNNLLTSLVSNNTALTGLDCSSNQLTALDVSNNTKLTSLNCNDNKLTSLDVLKNTALQELSCSNNPLTSLDLSKNTALTKLNCSNNQLTALDVSKNTALTSLNCYSNQIKGEAMDALVKSLPSADNSTFNIIYYKNEGNKMTTVQVAAAKAKKWIPNFYNGSNWVEYGGYDAGIEINETNFPDANFRTYLLAQSYGSDGVITDKEIASITIINVTERDISSLIGIEHFTALTMLRCYNNQLTALDVSNNTKLTELSCSINPLTSLDLSKNTALTYLYCWSNQLTALDVSNNTKLITLFCNNNQLTALDVSKNTELMSLYCYNNQLTTLDVSNNTKLIYLYCYNNQLTALDVSNNTKLTSLLCQNNQFKSLDVSNNLALTTLRCSDNQIKGEAMDALVESLPTVTKGTLMVIYNNNEGNEMTTAQVDAAKAKGWIPQYYDGSKWTEYAGVPVEFKLTYMVDGVEYKSSDVEYGATITPEVDPKKETYRFSGWSEIPETMPAKDVTITGTFERYYDIGNVVRLVKFVTNGNATTDDVELYDQNSDGELNIGDIILVVKWILNNDNSGPSNSRTRSYDVPDWTQYTAAQFDVKTTADTNIKEIRLVKSMEQTHQMMYQQKDAYTYTVVVYSLSNQLMKPENGGIVEIDTEDGSQNGLSIENVIVALPTGETQSYSSGQTATNIQQIEGDGAPAVVYDLKGNRMNVNSSLKKGVYIVNGKKVIVK